MSRKFYRNGQNLSNTVTLSTGNEKGGFHLSLTNADNKGIVPNNKFNRKGINLGFSYNLTEKLSFTGNMNYTNEKNTNPPNIANQDNSIPTTFVIPYRAHLNKSPPLPHAKSNK